MGAWLGARLGGWVGGQQGLIAGQVLSMAEAGLHYVVSQQGSQQKMLPACMP